jgi:hypothetical protein
VLRELGLAQIVRQRATLIQPNLEFVIRQRRFELAANSELLEADLTHEFPGEKEDIKTLLNRVRTISSALDPLFGADITLPPTGFWERRDVSRILGQLPPNDTDDLFPLAADHPLRAGIDVLGAFTTNFAPLHVSSLVKARALDITQRSTHRMHLGSDLRSLLQAKLVTFSGEVREHVVPTELVFRRGVLSGMRIRPRDETIGFGHLLWAASASSLLTLCKDNVPRRLHDTVNTIRPACYRYTLCLLLHAEAFPAGGGRHLISLRDSAKPILDDNAILITVGLPADRQPNQVPLWVECLVPAHASESIGYLSVVRAHLREELSRLIPGYERHLLVVASPYDGLAPEFGPSAAPATFVPVLPIPPIPLIPALNSDETQMMGFAMAPHRTGFKNVFLANGEILPGLGREGDFVSAWGVARLIAPPAHQNRKKKRQIVIEEL